MQHSLFDRIYLAFLAILIISFGFLIMFISYFARRSLISERIDTLSNEAQLIAKQSLTSYLEGKIDENTMADFMDYYSNMLKADIWYVDNNGTIIAKSNRKVVEKPATSTSTELTEEASENAYADTSRSRRIWAERITYRVFNAVYTQAASTLKRTGVKQLMMEMTTVIPEKSRPAYRRKRLKRPCSLR